jgi:hypothetical protein
MLVNVRVVKRKNKFVPQACTGAIGDKIVGDDIFSELFGSVFGSPWRDIIRSDTKEPITCDSIEEAIVYAEKYKCFHMDEVVWMNGEATDNYKMEEENEA